MIIELTVLGELRLEGTLKENNKPRKVLLFTTMLIIAKAKEDNRLQFKSYIHVSISQVKIIFLIADILYILWII